jgi:hypothetical protein
VIAALRRTPPGRHHKRDLPIPRSAYGWAMFPPAFAPYSFRKETR